MSGASAMDGAPGADTPWDGQTGGGPLRGRRSGRRTPAPVGLLLLLAVIIVAMVATDVLAGPVFTTRADPVGLRAADSGAWYCPVTGSDDERGAVTVAAVGDEPSTVTIEHARPSGASVEAPRELAPGAQFAVPLRGENRTRPVTVRWSGGPAVAAYRAEAGYLSAAPCAEEPSTAWFVSGLDTSLGSQSYLHLFNPFAIDAVARVAYGTPDGPVDLVRTENVSIPAGESLRLDVNRFQPEITNLGVTVQTLAGRLVVQGEVRLAPASQERGPTGRALVPAVTAPQPLAAWAFARVTDDATSWLTVYNPSEREAALEVSASAPRGGRPREISLPAGTTLRIPLIESSTEKTFAVAIRSLNDVPIVASRFADLRLPSRRALVAAPGSGRAFRRSALPIVPGGQGRLSVHLFNPGPEPVTAVARLGAADSGRVLQEVRLGPNQHSMFELKAPEGDPIKRPVLVDAEDGVVAELLSVGAPGGKTQAWSYGGLSEEAWRGPGERLDVRRDPLLDTVPVG